MAFIRRLVLLRNEMFDVLNFNYLSFDFLCLEVYEKNDIYENFELNAIKFWVGSGGVEWVVY